MKKGPPWGIRASAGTGSLMGVQLRGMEGGGWLDSESPSKVKMTSTWAPSSQQGEEEVEAEMGGWLHRGI